MRHIGVILAAVRDLRARRSAMIERAAKIASGSGARLELFHDLATPVYIDSLVGTGASVENLTRQASTRALQQLERWRLTAPSTSAARACSIISLVASRTTRLGSIRSPLYTSSTRLRVASLASTFFTGMVLSVDWIERRHSVHSTGHPTLNPQQL